ncbi:nucleoside-binding protein [Labedella gwakjiensis]|uniref:BMP family ABC transporter substrate-binding protein n=1 Tax=Labedella gwakjiensis TaxID=390269 RepID=A0A2P8GU26_9MICO|nr:BMP family ABC transporter substrate-binding protein [Labedella gwakjiensis]PSL37460.1 nucleoside-binding protein [Labedella gwakjiensis]RUQ84770.1 BMP family ABC transporter substrate-binding protein [Labedella gwakjiensis]
MNRFTGGPRRGTASRVLVLTVASGLVVALSACSSGRGGGSDDTDASSSGTEVTQFALVAPENESDYGYNQAGIEAANAAAEELGIDVTVVPDAGYDNIETVLNQVADGGAQFIVAHASGYNVGAAAAAAAKNVPILIQDAGEEENVPDQIAAVKPEGQEGGYLAGVAAAMATTSKKVGIVVSADNANWFAMSSGFAEGVYSVDPTIQVLYTSVGPAAYADAAGGKVATEQIIASGADVVFGMGDGATLGYLQAIEASEGVMYIADIGDVTPGLSDPSKLLTSVRWNYEPAYVQAIKDVEAGTFGDTTYAVDVENGGMYLQETDQLTSEITEAVDAAAASISDGSITPTIATSADEVAAVIAAKGE